MQFACNLVRDISSRALAFVLSSQSDHHSAVRLSEVWGHSPFFAGQCWVLRSHLQDAHLWGVAKKLQQQNCWLAMQERLLGLKQFQCPWEGIEVTRGGSVNQDLVMNIICKLAESFMTPALLKSVVLPGDFLMNADIKALESEFHQLAGESLALARDIVLVFLLPAGDDSGLANVASLSQRLILLQRKTRTSIHHPFTSTLVAIANVQRIPALFIDAASRLLQLGAGANSRLVKSTTNDADSFIGAGISSNKSSMRNLLSLMGFPVPREVRLRGQDISLKELMQAVDLIGGFPCVVKPQSSDRGEGVTAMITDIDDLKKSYDKAKKVSGESPVLLQNHIEGSDYRINMINAEISFVTKRSIPVVIGNGQDSIIRLIEKHNHEKTLMYAADGISKRIDCKNPTLLARLSDLDMSLDFILPDGQSLPLARSCNLSQGGLLERLDVESVHPVIASQCRSIAKTLRLDVCGIDYMTPDISADPMITSGSYLEANFMPQMSASARAEDMFNHLFPDKNEVGFRSILVVVDSAIPLSSHCISRINLLSQEYPDYVLACPCDLVSELRNTCSPRISCRLKPFQHPRELIVDKSIAGVIAVIPSRLLLEKGWPGFGHEFSLENCSEIPLEPASLWMKYLDDLTGLGRR